MKIWTFIIFTLILVSGGQAEETLPKKWDPIIRTHDGHDLRCTYYQPATDTINIDAKAVILVHMLGGDKEDWNTLPEKLSKEGLAVLVLELRGHSKPINKRDHWKYYEKKEFASMVHDITAAKEWLKKRKKVHIEKFALCGARFGANLCLNAMKDDDELLAAYCLSPANSYRQLAVDYSLEGIKDRPLKLVCSSADLISAPSLEQFKKEADVETEILKSTHATQNQGTELLRSHDDLEGKIVDWLKANF